MACPLMFGSMSSGGPAYWRPDEASSVYAVQSTWPAWKCIRRSWPAP